MNEQERLSHYDEHYFIGRSNVETLIYRDNSLRPDQCSALAYALGMTSFSEVEEKIPGVARNRDRPPPDLLDRQVIALADHARRTPGLVLDVGCGRGELMAVLIRLDLPCIGIDPSPGSATLIPLVLKRLADVDDPGLRFRNTSFYGAVSSLCHHDFDTILFCESIEHIPSKEFELGWTFARRILDRTGGLCIFTNWIGYHPIHPDGTGYDHIRVVDDAFYDRLAGDAKSTVFREGSHLVLQF